MPNSLPRARQTGLSLLEVAALVSGSAVLLAMLVPTFVRQLRLSKISEATTELDRLHQSTAAYYARYHRMPGGQRERGCIPESAGPTPAVATAEAASVDFHADDTPGQPTWQALQYQPVGPVRYRYSLVTEHTGCAPRTPEPSVLLTLRAEGDLDGDGVLSSLERDAGPRDGALVPVGVLRTVRRVE